MVELIQVKTGGQGLYEFTGKLEELVRRSGVEEGIVLNGDVFLNSPEFDVADYEEPRLSFYYHFFNIYIQGDEPSPGPNELIFNISNGDSTVEVIGFTYDAMTEAEWLYFEIDLDSVIGIK